MSSLMLIKLIVYSNYFVWPTAKPLKNTEPTIEKMFFKCWIKEFGLFLAANDKRYTTKLCIKGLLWFKYLQKMLILIFSIIFSFL